MNKRTLQAAEKLSDAVEATLFYDGDHKGELEAAWLTYCRAEDGQDGPQVYVLYGVAERDRNELVCQFFKTKKERRQFAKDLPGFYRKMTLHGIDLDDFDVYLPEGR